MKLISSNRGKIKEFRAILGKIDSVKFDLIEIQSTDVEEVIKHKIEDAKKVVSGEFIVEDTALYLGGNMEIGALIKWIPNEVVVKAYKGQSAWAVCAIGHSDGSIYSGEVKGIIVKPRGDNGFGFDKIFQPDGYTKTFAEMTAEEKNKISPRRLALEELLLK